MVHKSDYVDTGGTPLVNPANIIDGKIWDKRLMGVNDVKAKELDRYKLSCGDILIARRGDLSKCAIVSEKEENWLCGTGSFFLHVPFVLPRYIEIFYSSEYVQSRLKQECVGATMDNLNQSVLGNILFLLPPVAEQVRIVDSVEQWISVVNALENEANELSANIQQIKSKILDIAIHGKLVPQDPNDEPAIELIKRINPKFTPCDNAHYGNVPHGWCMVRGQALFHRMESIKPTGKEFVYIDVEAIDNKSNTISNPKLTPVSNAPSRATRKLHVGDVLFSMVRPYLKNIALVTSEYANAIGSTGFYVLNPTEVIISDYLYYLMLSSYVVEGLNQYMKGDNSPSITNKDIENFIFPVPPLNEQYRIVVSIKQFYNILDSISAEL